MTRSSHRWRSYDVIVTRESHERLLHALDAYAAKHGLRGWVDAGESLLVVTDHGQSLAWADDELH